MHVLIFRAAGHTCAIRAQDIDQIVHIAATVRIPGQPAIVEGFLNVRGQPVAVVPLSRLFHVPEQPAGLYAPIVIARRASARVGLLADSVDGVATVEQTAIAPLDAAHSLNDCAEGQFDSEYGSVVLLSTERILLAQEQRRIAEIAEQVRTRLAGLEGPAA